MSLRTGVAGYKYITVVHHPYPGYRAQIPHPETNGPLAIKVFAGYRYSLDFYLQQAVKWRDAVYQSLYGKPLPSRVLHWKPTKSDTGVPGVRRIEKISRKTLKSGQVRVYRIACIIAEVHLIPGIDYTRARASRSRVFSIVKHGEEEALRLAIEWRTQMRAVLEQGPESGSSADPALPSKRHVAKACAPYEEMPPETTVEAAYDPGRLFDLLVLRLDLASDRALAKLLGMQPATLSKLRNQKLPLGPSVLLRMHDVSRLSINALRSLMGDRRASYRFGSKTRADVGCLCRDTTDD